MVGATSLNGIRRLGKLGQWLPKQHRHWPAWYLLHWLVPCRQAIACMGPAKGNTYQFGTIEGDR